MADVVRSVLVPVASLVAIALLPPIGAAFVIAGLTLVSQALAPDIPGFTTEARDRSVTARATAAPKTLVMGEVALGGQLALFESAGSSKEFLHVVVAHADHPCDAIDEWLVNNDPVGARDGSGNVTAGRFSGHLRLVAHLGALDQAAAPNLVAEVANWTTDHKGGGVAYTEARLKWSADVWPNGFQGIRAQLRGMPVYDTRDAGVAIVSSTAADPAVFTTGAVHGRSVGDQVWIKSHLGAIATVGGQPIRFAGKWHQVASVPTTTSLTLIDLDGAAVAFTTGGTGGTVTAMAWSDNWALLVRMYLTHRATYDAQDDEIDDATVTASANICDEQVALTPEAETFTADPATDRVTLANARTWKTGDKVDWTSSVTLPAGIPANSFVTRYSATEYGLATTLENARARTAIDITDAGTGTHTATRVSQLRYTANGVIRLGQDPHKPLDALMTAAAGVVVTEGGVVKIYAGAATTAGDPTDASDLRDADLDLVPFLDRQKIFNAARGTFVDPDQFWTEGDAPPVTNALYRSEDNGELIFADLKLPFTTDPVMAQRLLKIALERARQGATLKFPAKPRKYASAVWDVETVTIDHLGYAAKEFRVMAWAERPDFGIDILYREEAAAAYDWNLGDETTIDLAPNSNLPDPFTVAPPTAVMVESGSVALYTRLDGTIGSRLKITWTQPADEFVIAGGRIRVEAKRSADTDYEPQQFVDGGATLAYVLDVEDGVNYDVRLQSENGLGARSAFATVLNHPVLGKGAKPLEPDTFTVTRLADGTRQFDWTQVVVDADVRTGGGYEIRYFLGSTSDWTAMTPLHTGLLQASPLETNQLAAGTYTFAIKTVDSSGNESTAAKFINSAVLGDPRLENVLAEHQAHILGWPGVLTDCFVDDDNIVYATSAGDWSNLPATWSALAATWEEILTNSTPIRYETVTIDLGLDINFTPLASASGSGTFTFEMQTGTAAQGSPQPPYVALAPVTGARYIKVRVSSAGTTPRFKTITVLIDSAAAEDIFEDVNTATETATWFNSIAAGHFQIGSKSGDLAAISVARILALQNVGGGWTWELINKTSTVNGEPAAEFKTYNATPALADATIDVSLKGPKE